MLLINLWILLKWLDAVKVEITLHILLNLV